MKEHWMADPEEHDYPAAGDYLTLVLPKAEATKRVEELRRAPVELRKAKDLLRASRLKPLGKDNFHVAKDLDKVKSGKKLSPVLIVRGDIAHGAPMIIADGYHRICASYLIDENADIPCRIAG